MGKAPTAKLGTTVGEREGAFTAGGQEGAPRHALAEGRGRGAWQARLGRRADQEPRLPSSPQGLSSRSGALAPGWLSDDGYVLSGSAGWRLSIHAQVAVPCWCEAERPHAAIVGTVIDSEWEHLLPGVSVTVSSSSSPGEMRTETDATGVYRLDGVSPGTYSIRFEREKDLQ
ncbi:carboxypeptidase-like regulatory domain-containing protein [Myxococcus sp. AB056]|uniref:carboxypeptidase-like regulatory domain-containing protein n=1 Tax=Myxococcus sp. AB056 TaxID=2562792 RepID=UPI001146CCD6